VMLMLMHGLVVVVHARCRRVCTRRGASATGRRGWHVNRRARHFGHFPVITRHGRLTTDTGDTLHAGNLRRGRVVPDARTRTSHLMGRGMRHVVVVVVRGLANGRGRVRRRRRGEDRVGPLVVKPHVVDRSRSRVRLQTSRLDRMLLMLTRTRYLRVRRRLHLNVERRCVRSSRIRTLAVLLLLLWNVSRGRGVTVQRGLSRSVVVGHVRRFRSSTRLHGQVERCSVPAHQTRRVRNYPRPAVPCGLWWRLH
jgi:hypothetical protein